MAFAVTHVIIAIVLIDLYRDYIAKKKFSTWYVLIGGVAGLLPDADIVVGWFLSLIFQQPINVHRIFSHSLIFVFIFLLIALFYHVQENKKFQLFNNTLTYGHISLFFVVVAVGWFLHVALDCLFAPGFLTYFPGAPITVCSFSFSQDFLLGLDALILLGWLIHEQWAHQIKDYI